MNSFGGRAALEMHPTVKPVALIADAIRDCSNRRAIVLDPFGGSGSTLIAAERTGRKARLIEIDARYADTIVRRWQGLTGGEAVDAASRTDLRPARGGVFAPQCARRFSRRNSMNACNGTGTCRRTRIIEEDCGRGRPPVLAATPERRP